MACGVFKREDNYARRRWRQIHYLADQFWIRWTREYLQTLQLRHKWTKLEKNYKVNDVVLLYDEHVPRSKWKLGRIVEVYPDRCNKSPPSAGKDERWFFTEASDKTMPGAT